VRPIACQVLEVHWWTAEVRRMLRGLLAGLLTLVVVVLLVACSAAWDRSSSAWPPSSRSWAAG